MLGSGELPFVGRKDELAALQGYLAGAVSGQGGVVLIAGEPGIGKTRLLEVLAAGAEGAGALALWGRCYEGDGAPAFWPWLQVLRSYAATRTAADLRDDLGAGAADIAQVAPELRALLPDLPPPLPLEPDQARFRFFESCAAFLGRAAAARPLILIVDDLHWADRSSLLLLEFLARDVRAMRVLMLGAYRETDITAEHVLTPTLASLRRGPAHHRMTLHGLDEPAIAELTELVAPEAAAAGDPRALPRLLRERTEGNPFYIQETLRHLAESGLIEGAGPSHLLPAGEPAGVPQGVREVVEVRLSRLSPATREVLDHTAVLGREFTVDIVSRMMALNPTGESMGAVLAALVGAEAAHLIEPVTGAPGRFRFVHALVRETIYEALGSARRTPLHLRAGEALEQAYRVDLEPHLADLAHHFFLGLPGGDAGRAVDYAERAGERALRLLAFDEAAAQFERAAAVIEHSGGGGARRCVLLLRLGEARFLAGGHARAVRGRALEAAALARRLGEPELLARAVLLFARTRIRYFAYDQELIDLLQEALSALGPADSPWQVRLLARLVVALSTLPEAAGEAAEASTQALAMARRLGDPKSLVMALMSAHLAGWTPENAAHRLELTTEASTIAVQAGITDLELLDCLTWRYVALIELGDVAAADTVMRQRLNRTEALRSPAARGLLLMTRASRALLAGEFDAGIRLARESMRLSERMGLLGFAGQPPVTLFFLHREQGRIADDEALITGLARVMPGWLVVRCVVAILHRDLGRMEEAREAYEALAERDFTDLSRGFGQGYQLALALLAELCVAFGDQPRAARLYERLLPLSGHIAVYSEIACAGAADRYLGLLATLLRRWPDAEHHFEQAVALNRRTGAVPWLAHTWHEYAAMLIARNAPGDGDRARPLLDQADAAASALGMSPLAAQIADLRPRLDAIPTAGPSTAYPDGLTAREVEVLRYVASGLTNRQIAERLVLSARTVERHIAHIYGKCNLATRAEATLYAVRHGLLDSPHAGS